MNTPDNSKKRGLPLSAARSSTKKPYLATSIRPTAEDEKNLVEIKRLLHAMNTSDNSSSSWNALLMRADLLQVLWQKVSPALQAAQDPQWQTSQQQVTAACQRAQQQAAAQEGHPVDATIRRVFEPASAVVASVPVTSPAPAAAPAATAPAAAAPAAPRTAAPPVNIADMQKEQRAQMEQAIATMAEQMKHETARIHSTLQHQTQNLTELEQVATDQVDQVTAVAKDVQEHVASNWTRTVSTWTMIFLLVGVFAFTLATIVMVPKRNCLFCRETADQLFCRVLPNGQRECLDLASTTTKTDEEEQAVPASAGRKPTAVPASPKTEKNCELDVHGNCLPPKATGMDVFAQAVDANVDNIPLLNGKPFSPSDFRKAAATGLVDILESMLRQLQATDKMDWINSPDSNGWTALHLAARAGRTAVLQVLLEQEACEAQAMTKTGRTALDVAVGKFGRNHPAVILLAQYVEEKEDDEEEDPKQNKASMEPFTVADLHAAAQAGNTALLERMLDERPEWINAQDQNGWGAIHQATRANKIDAVLLLFKKKCDMLLETNSGHTPMKLAFEQHGPDSPVTNFLWDPQMTMPSTKYPFSPHDVRRAAQEGDEMLLRQMLSKKRKWSNRGDRNQWNALHLAARAGHLSIVELLLESGADPTLQTRSGHTAYQIAKDKFGEDHAVTRLLAG